MALCSSVLCCVGNRGFVRLQKASFDQQASRMPGVKHQAFPVIVPATFNALVCPCFASREGYGKAALQNLCL